jgi:predicted unusual protein kinase regulating ubiquinone biosynthesis (AarF/ABC1/UbiB family)
MVAPKTNTMARGFRIGKLGFSLVGSYLGYQAQNLLFGENQQAERKSRFQKKASQRVRQELGALKGPIMKIGQMLSMQSGLMSEEASRELANLQMHAPAMHATLARAQFKSSLGKYPEDVFREFEPEPFAAASLGQVHRAITKSGQRMVVKIQYPAIRDAIENDFKLLRSTTLAGQLTGHIPKALLDELQRGILEETDYVREADNLEYFGKGLGGLDYLTIPRPLRELSTDRVLTMSHVEGESLAKFLARNPSRATRDLVGARLVEIFYTQFQYLQALHTDLHPGNYLFQPDGRIGLVDFGCVKYTQVDLPELRRYFDNCAWREGEKEARKFLAMAFGKDVPYARARKILPVMDRIMDLIHPPGSDFIFGNQDAKTQARLMKMANEYWMQLFRDKMLNPEFAFIVRADFGLQCLVLELGAVVNITEVWNRICATCELPKKV